MNGIKHAIVSPADWRGPDILKREDWIHHLSESEITEIERALVNAKAQETGFEN